MAGPVIRAIHACEILVNNWSGNTGGRI
jgi:hypothetical protein